MAEESGAGEGTGRSVAVERIVARNVRRLREQRGLSMTGLARHSGIAKGTLSRLEVGEANPTIETLAALAAALDVGIERLVVRDASPTMVYRASEAAWTTGQTVRTRGLGRVYGSGVVQLLELDLDGDGQEFAAHSPGTLAHLLTLTGRIEAGPTVEPVRLEAGDAIRFLADQPHVVRPLDGAARAHVVLTVPASSTAGLQNVISSTEDTHRRP